MAKDDDPQRGDEEVPRIGRGRPRFRLPQRELMAIFALLIMLFAVLALRKSCAGGVANLFKALEPIDAGPPQPAPPAPPP